LHQLKNIIEGLLCDSPQAMKRMFDLFYKPLCSYAARYAQSMPVAEEIVSDVMYKIWQNRHNGYRPETFRDYLYTATRNTALNYQKQQQSQRMFTDVWTEDLRNELIEETPLDSMIARETQMNLNNLIDALPEQCRKAFLMSRVDDKSYDEIATQMNISTNTVKYHIKTALQKLHAGIDSLIVYLILFWTLFVIFLLHIPTLFPLSVVYIVSSIIP
jgi:RNA polymerase sigma-70 factor (ECF subfamily)